MRIYLLLLLFLMPFAYADGGEVGQNVTIWADIFNSTNYYLLTDSANITIINENGTTVVNNTAMDSLGIGKYKSVFVPTSIGNYYTYVNFYQSGNKIATASESLEIRQSDENKMIGLTIAILLGLIGFIFVYGASSIKTEEIPAKRVPEKLVLYILTLATILMMSGFLHVYVNNNSSISYFQKPAEVFFSVVIWCVFAIISFFLIYLLEVIFGVGAKRVEEDGS